MNCLVLGLALSMHVGLENNYNQVHPYVMCEQNQVKWKWVKGHSNNKYNNLADELATQAIKN